MLESTFLEDWGEIGTKMAKKGHLLPKRGINSELVSIQRVNGGSTVLVTLTSKDECQWVMPDDVIAQIFVSLTFSSDQK